MGRPCWACAKTIGGKRLMNPNATPKTKMQITIFLVMLVRLFGAHKEAYFILGLFKRFGGGETISKHVLDRF